MTKTVEMLWYRRRCGAWAVRIRRSDQFCTLITKYEKLSDAEEDLRLWMEGWGGAYHGRRTERPKPPQWLLAGTGIRHMGEEP